MRRHGPVIAHCTYSVDFTRSGPVSEHFFVPEPEHAIRCTESWCVAYVGRWGVVRRECEQQMSIGQYLTPAPSTQQAGRRATDRSSTLLLMTLEFQEPATAITPLATHEAIPPPLPSSSA